MRVLLAMACAVTRDDPAATPDRDTHTETEPEPVDCTDPCADTTTDAGYARCYACRCKAAMDGWLPGPEELQCGEGAPIEVYVADAQGTLDEVDEGVDACANPTLLYGTCAPGGTLGQLQHKDVHAKWICRRNTARDDPDAPYDDVGLILYNERTGASCWFDDMDATGLGPDNWPAMDLTRPDADVDAWLRFFYVTDGDGCVGCHDNDPFVYTPYLQSVGWRSGPWVFGSFQRVTLDGSLVSTGASHLVSPEAAACTSCHRITSSNTCATWAPESIGAYKGGGYQAHVAQAAGDLDSPLWHLGTWMPPSPGTDGHAWHARNGAAAALVTACCLQPGVDQPATGDTPACTWEPVP